MSKASKLPVIHVLSYTHWDREFRFDFETTRSWLVILMDRLIEIMEADPEYKHFTMDGQFVLIDDYLEIRPEMRERLQKLARDGRLSTGPWYTLPDSSAIHGEALVRNLMTGRKMAQEFGGSIDIGYNVFSFGQISQLPQLYAGFGIDFIIFYKYMNPSRTKNSEFIWEGPDGTRTLASRLGTEARWNYFMMGHVPTVFGQDPAHKDWQYHWGKMGKTFHVAEADDYADFHFVTEALGGFDREKVREGFERTLKTLKSTAAPEHLLFWDGIDFTEANPDTPEILEAAREAFKGEYEIVHSSLTEYVNGIKPLLKQRELDTAYGEMKDGPVGAVHTDVCSSHPQLKKLNSTVENKLYRQAEPLATLAWLQGADYPASYINRVQKIMFTTQAHDSLHGIGPGSMISDLENRHRQGVIIAENTAKKAMQDLCLKIDTQSVGSSEILLTVFNPAPWKRSQVMTAVIDVPRKVRVDHLYIETDQGERVSVHVLDRREERAGLYHPRGRNMPIYGERFEVLFEAKDIPGLGYRTFAVTWDEKREYPYPHEGFVHPCVSACPLATSPRTAENEHVKVSLNGDGTFELFDKKTGKVYSNLNSFMDNGEIGNIDVHIAPDHDTAISSLGGTAEVSLEVSSHLMAKFNVKLTMSVPLELDTVTNRRSVKRIDIPISYSITLRKDSRMVEVECTFDNRAKDHFLRVVFPSGLKAEKVHAGALFDTLEFPVKHESANDWAATGLTRHQQHLFMNIQDKTGGLAVLNDTLREFEIIDPVNGVIAQSLVRGVPLKIPVDNRLWMEYPGDDSAQSLGSLTLRYALLPHDGAWDKEGIPQQAQNFATKMRVIQLGSQSGTLPAVFSGVSLNNPQIQFSCFKRSEAGDMAVLRLFNPCYHEEKVTVTFGQELERACLLNLNEEFQEEVAFGGNQVSLTITNKKVVTLGIKAIGQ